MSNSLNLNQRSASLAESIIEDPEILAVSTVASDVATVIDFGVSSRGGISAGLMLARMCMADLADIRLHPASAQINVPQVFVHTDHPLQACLLSQYAGWKIATDDFFGMGSGPIRAAVGTEQLFSEFDVSESDTDSASACVGILETGSLPTDSALELVRQAVGRDRKVILAVAPTASSAGSIQVVARSVETALHKLHELQFPVERIVSGCGAAPLPPVAHDDLHGIGRTNDSILYGAAVNLWVDCEDSLIHEFGPRTPSSSSSSHGQSFLSLFKSANCDFYALDKALFSPAVVVFHNVTTGNSFRFGQTVPDLLHDSFGL